MNAVTPTPPTKFVHAACLDGESVDLISQRKPSIIIPLFIMQRKVPLLGLSSGSDGFFPSSVGFGRLCTAEQNTALHYIMFHLSIFKILIVSLWAIQLSYTENARFRPSPLFGDFLMAQSRSWSPSSGSLVFPTNDKPTTNAGKLNYQIEDGTRNVPAPPPPPPPPRPSKSVLFPADVTSSASSSSSARQPNSEFRPSPPIPFVPSIPEENNEQRKRENVVVTAAPPPPFLDEEPDDIPIKTGRLIPGFDFNVQQQQAAVQSISITEAPSPAESDLASDYSDLVDAMEQLVERLNDLEQRLVDSEAERLEERKNTRSITEENVALTANKVRLETDVGALLERTSSLELRLSSLEELTREWLDPNILAYDSFGKSNGFKTQVRYCPDQFFSLNETDAAAPCYHISTTANYRKNWQDAALDCQRQGAKLAEPHSSEELLKLAEYLRDKRPDQLGGGYWTGGINPGLMWLWPTTGRTLDNIAPWQWMAFSESNPTEADNGKCLRLSYDRGLQRYSLQGSDCQRYLYFVCEYVHPTTRTDSASPVIIPVEETTTTTTTTTAAPPSTAPPRSIFTRPSAKTRTPTVRPAKPTAPPTPNYIGVIGFKDLPRNETTNREELNLAILSDNF